jgi:hypothetical protein
VGPRQPPLRGAQPLLGHGPQDERLNGDDPASFLLWNDVQGDLETLTLRITAVTSADPGTLRLEGRLRSEEVPELERSAEVGVKALDLEDLQSADEEGLAVLRRLRDRGIEIRNPSHYLAMLLA